MKGAKLTRMISCLLVAIMLLSCLPITSASAATSAELTALISQAESLRDGNSEYPMQVSNSNGSDVDPSYAWVTAEEMEAFEVAIADAKHSSNTDEAYEDLSAAIELFKSQMKSDGSDPYFRVDPGMGPQPVEIAAPTNEWTARRPFDNRVPSDFAGGSLEMIDYPFADSNGMGQLIKINYIHNGTSTFGGVSYQSPLDNTVNVPAGSTIEFDVYYPKSAEGKFMRWRFASSGYDSYLRDYEYNNLNPDWVDSYMGETYLKVHVSLNAPTGNMSTFNLELHGETGRAAETGTLLIGDLKITAPDTNTPALPMVQNTQSQSAVAPLKSLYNEENGLFMVGAIGTGNVTGTRARHYSIFVDGNNLKADSTHPRAPKWLVDVNGVNRGSSSEGIGEYSIPTNSYTAIRDSGEPGEYAAHAHVLAWYNQAPSWMAGILPEHLENGYNGSVNFYGLGNGIPSTTYAVDKDVAKRVQFNHIVYVMRHFLTTDAKYGSSESRGVVPFHSWDVLNEEVHESRHSQLIPENSNTWRDALKHTNWLVAMSDDDIDGDITDHYIYLLFKYAHIAAPNAMMAEKYKANYDSLPEYMKLDGHDDNGSIDAYVQENPPALTYNDYGTSSHTKSRVMYNMIKELNTAWQSDPLYDGRPLIEVVGFQGHDSVSPTLASDNQYAMSMFASLIDEGLLSGISFSEFDLKLLTDAPGGGSTAPAALNVRQSDALGYEYGLMYKLFTKFADYVDHIISWGVTGSGWQGAYVLFDQQSNANAGYYAAMDPDRFILGHSYLDYYFDGEYDKLADDYTVELDGLGTYKPQTNPKPVLIDGLKNQTIEVAEGETVALFANANFAEKYQWTVEGTRARAYSEIPGANGRAYYVTATADLNGSKYRAAITNENGTIYGPVYTLKVTSAPVEPTPTAPVITSGTVPQVINAKVGETATMSITATGAETYQWYCNDVAISGANKATYTTAALSMQDDNDVYHCVVSNAAGSVTGPDFTLNVTMDAPVITSGTAPKTINAKVGETATMGISATGAETYQWYINRNDGKNYVELTGADEASYTTTELDMDCNGFTYFCRVSNAGGYVDGPVITLVVSEVLPLPTVTTSVQTVTLYVGETTEFAVYATNAETYQWYINRNDGEGYVEIEGATASTYTTSPVDEECDGFTYRCKVSNATGSVDSAVITLLVNVPTPPATGDNFNLPLWLTMFVVCAGAVVLFGIYNKKAQKAQ